MRTGNFTSPRSGIPPKPSVSTIVSFDLTRYRSDVGPLRTYLPALDRGGPR